MNTLRKKVEPKRLHPSCQNGSINQGGTAGFSLLFEVADKSFFLDKNSSTFEGGTKIVPRVELSYVPFWLHFFLSAL